MGAGGRRALAISSACCGPASRTRRNMRATAAFSSSAALDVALQSRFAHTRGDMVAIAGTAEAGDEAIAATTLVMAAAAVVPVTVAAAAVVTTLG